MASNRGPSDGVRPDRAGGPDSACEGRDNPKSISGSRRNLGEAMPRSFFDQTELCDEQIDTLTVAIRRWCDAAAVKPGSWSARPATEHAIDLVAGHASSVTSQQLLEALLRKFPP